MNSTAKTIVFWIALLVASVFLIETVQHRPPSLQAVPRPSSQKKVEYSIIPVEPSVEALRSLLETKGNEGWEVAAPVVGNGTTVELILKREKK
jgi:hypothetical protein